MNRPLSSAARTSLECVGRADSLNDAVRFTREGGTVVRSGCRAREKGRLGADLAARAHLTGAYAYGAEPKRKGQRRSSSRSRRRRKCTSEG